jgi:hypothetical protein
MEDQSYLLLGKLKFCKKEKGKLKLEYEPTQTQELISEIFEHKTYTI